MTVKERNIFVIEADRQQRDIKPFDDIHDFSDFANEQEVLFMLGAIFRLDKIYWQTNEMWKIDMTQCTDDDNQSI